MNSQHSPERERHATRYNSLGPRNIPPLPPGLELMRPNGTFYPYEMGANVIGTPDGYILGIREPNGALRPFFCNRIIVMLKREGIRGYTIIPLTLQEYRRFNYNSDITTHTDRFLQYIGELRRGPIN